MQTLMRREGSALRSFILESVGHLAGWGSRIRELSLGISLDCGIRLLLRRAAGRGTFNDQSPQSISQLVCSCRETGIVSNMARQQVDCRSPHIA
jgi:hypothetical protein